MLAMRLGRSDTTNNQWFSTHAAIAQKGGTDASLLGSTPRKIVWPWIKYKTHSSNLGLGFLK
jgi:hypothetical protein